MFVYSVYYYDDLNEKMANDKGLVSAATFEEATDKVVNNLYDNVVSVAIHSLETSEYGYATFSDLDEFLSSMKIDMKKEE